MSRWLERLGLSPEQLAALRDRSPRVLVAAAAGSGKTLLLSAFYLQALLEECLPVEKVIAVTFTRKAGAELVRRIRGNLVDLGYPDLARSLDIAIIGTIHSLCHRLLRDNAVTAGVDPGFGILEAEAAKLAKEQVSRQAWKAAVEAASPGELEVLATRGDKLRRGILSTYDRLRGMGCVPPQVVVDGDEGEEVSLSDARDRLLACAEAFLAEAVRQPRPSATLLKAVERVTACRDFLGEPICGEEEEALRATTQFFAGGQLPRALGPLLQEFRFALTDYRGALAGPALRYHLSAVNLLLRTFDQQYRDFKDSRGVLDFADLELHAKVFLEAQRSQDDSPLPYEGAWVLVDEFQDTNELQCAILENLGAARLILVGDERQSIYRFRGADVGVFRRRRKSMREGLHVLEVNYRSRPPVLAFVERIFYHPNFFGADMGRLQAARSEAGAAWEAAAPAVEVVVALRSAEPAAEGESLSTRELEAEAVGEVVTRVLGEGRSPREIVVLLPTMTEVNLYEEALRRRGVDVYVVAGKGYFSKSEISDIGAFLKLLVNPHDDLALCAVLRSPLVGLTDDGLYLLGRSRRERSRASLWETMVAGDSSALGEHDREAINLFLGRLRSLRSRVGRPGLSRLCDEAVSLFDYDLHLLACTDGRQRYANLRKLMRMAEEFETLNGPDLAGFVGLLETLEELGDEEGSAPSLAEGEDVVRLMTVHQAKGLEFPVVVLGGLGFDVGGNRSDDAVLLGKEGRAAVLLKGSGHDTYEKHDLCLGPAASLLAGARQESMEEDARLLYVAMTRARDKLVLVGGHTGAGCPTGRRIGRVLQALGLDALPPPGEEWKLPDLDGVVCSLPVVARPPAQAAAVELGSAGADPDLSEGTRVATGTCLPVLEGYRQPVSTLRRISFSALAAYERCPRRFYLERILGLTGFFANAGKGEPAEEQSDHVVEAVLDEAEILAGREVGLLAHALLERADVQGPAPSPAQLDELASEIMVERGIALGPDAKGRATELALGFWGSPVQAAVAEAGAGEVLREAPFVFGQGGIVVSGVVDLGWEEPGGRRRIADYKTNVLGKRTPAQAAEEYRLQAEVYCLAALRTGAREVRMDFVFLEKPQEPVTFEYSWAQQSTLEASLERQVSALQEGSFPALRGPGCSGCAVEDLCEAVASSSR